MNIAIVEDESIHIENLMNCINYCCEKHSIYANIDCYNDGIEIIDKNEIFYDIIYFDIKMNFVNGMEAAKEVRKRDPEVIIVFCTNFIQYAIDGYSVNAADFLLKPITKFAFYEHFKKILPKIEVNDEPSLVIKTKLGVKKIKHNSILYIESEGHYLNVVCKNEKVAFLESMKNIEKELDRYNFYRCNSCYIVNMKYVKEVTSEYVVLDGYELKISRARKKGFMEALTNFIGDEI